MEGVVDSIMRETLTSFGGIDACVTEFMRVTDSVHPAHVFHRYAPELSTHSRTLHKTPVYFQLLGGQVGPLAENAALAVKLGVSGIDLNFGCPAPTVNRHDGGATLLKFPDRIFNIVKAVRAAVPDSHSVSAKLRLGFSDESLFLENAKACEEANVSWLTIHARTRDDQYRPPAKWHFLTELKRVTKTPLIANGEIWTPEDAHRCRTLTGIHPLMLGRGLLARPSLAREISDGTAMTTWKELAPTIQQFIETCTKAKGERFAVARIKQWSKWLGRTYPEALTFFENIKRCETVSPILSLLTIEG
jgi:tRNA-dihydrouridine synthase C